ncbi:hypothetical protein JCM10213_002658 [Rhodosporidiobolus nylandii]
MTDDLLAETLADNSHDGTPGERDYTDDLEDIVSMAVAQQLHSRKSHSTIQTFLPSGASPPLPPPLPSPASPLLQSSVYRISSSPSPSYAASSGDEDVSSTSRGVAGAAGRPGKRRPSAIPRPNAGGRASRTPSPELGRRKGSLAPSEAEVLPRGPEFAADEEDEGEERWETLQVGSAPASSPSPAAAGRKRGVLTPSPSRSPAPTKTAKPNGHSPSSAATRGGKTSTPSGRAKTLDFPSASPSPATATPSRAPGTAGRARPSATSTSRASPSSTASGTPRPRAQTQAPHLNSGGASPSPSPSARARPSAPAASPSDSPSTRTRRPSAPRTQTAPTRRKSLTAAQELADLRTRAGADPVSSAPLSGGAQPAWSADPAPLVYRTSQGDLAFASSAATAGGEHDPRWKMRPEDRVLPAVARRLEAERLAALQKGGGGAGEDGVLVSEWEKDGTPRSAVSWNSRRGGGASPGGGAGTPATEVQANGAPEKGGTSQSPPSGALPPAVGDGAGQPTYPPTSLPQSEGQQPLDRRGSTFQSYHLPSSHPSSQSLSGRRPISLAPDAPSAAEAESEKPAKEQPLRTAEQEEGRGKKGGCCACVIA